MPASCRPTGCRSRSRASRSTCARSAPRGCRPSLGPEDALALAARPDELDGDADLALDQLDVLARGIRESCELLGLVQRLQPARQLLVDGLGVVEVALVSGQLTRRLPAG